jgi:hypothetical protein
MKQRLLLAACVSVLTAGVILIVVPLNLRDAPFDRRALAFLGFGRWERVEIVPVVSDPAISREDRLIQEAIERKFGPAPATKEERRTVIFPFGAAATLMVSLAAGGVVFFWRR